MEMEDGFPESCRVLSQIDFDVLNDDRRRDLFSLIRVLFLQRIFLPLLVLRCRLHPLVFSQLRVGSMLS